MTYLLEELGATLCREGGTSLKAAQRARHHIKRPNRTNKTKGINYKYMWPKNHRSQATRLRYQHSEITLHSAMCPGLKSPNINHTSRTVWKVLNLFSMAAASSSFATNEQTAIRIWSLIGQRAQKDERRELWAAPMLMMCFTSPRKNDNQNTKLKYIHYLT